MENRLIYSAIYVMFYGLPVYLLLDVYTLPRDLHIGAIFAILLTCIQFGNLETMVKKLEDDFYRPNDKKTEQQ